MKFLTLMGALFGLSSMTMSPIEVFIVTCGAGTTGVLTVATLEPVGLTETVSVPLISGTQVQVFWVALPPATAVTLLQPGAEKVTPLSRLEPLTVNVALVPYLNTGLSTLVITAEDTGVGV